MYFLVFSSPLPRTLSLKQLQSNCINLDSDCLINLVYFEMFKYSHVVMKKKKKKVYIFLMRE